MRKSFAFLTHIDNNCPVRETMDSQFLRELKLGILLALREQALLTDLQLRLAMEELGWTD